MSHILLDEFGEVAQQRRHVVSLHFKVVQATKDYTMFFCDVVVLLASGFVQLRIAAQL